MLRAEVYFDNAATTPLLPGVKEAMVYAMEVYGNPASIHAEGRRSRVFLEDCRTRVAEMLGVQPAEVFFTSGGTESLQTVLFSALRDLGIERVITTPLEHPAILKNLEQIGQIFPFAKVYAPFDPLGRIDLAGLEEILREPARTLVVLMHANNETGMLLPLRRVSALCREYGALFLSDTVQTMGKYRLDFSDGVDFAAASAHKFHGPKGAGLLYVRGGTGLKPLIYGGGQERMMRSGTENIIGIAGMVEALMLASETMEQSVAYVSQLRESLMQGITETVPGSVVLTDMDHSLYTILNIGFPKSVIGEMLVYKLDMERVAVSGGSACASGVNNPSHVLRALGVSEEYENIRFSLSRFNTAAEVNQCLNIIKKIYERFREFGN